MSLTAQQQAVYNAVSQNEVGTGNAATTRADSLTNTSGVPDWDIGWVQEDFHGIASQPIADAMLTDALDKAGFTSQNTIQTIINAFNSNNGQASEAAINKALSGVSLPNGQTLTVQSLNNWFNNGPDSQQVATSISNDSQSDFQSSFTTLLSNI